MNIFKKFIALCMSFMMVFTCTFANENTSAYSGVSEDNGENYFAPAQDSAVLQDVADAPKTIYNFSCHEKISLSNAATTTSENPVSGYTGYTDQFLINPASFPAFEGATVLRRAKAIASNITYNQSAYANKGNLLDGKDGRDYFMSFDISSGATFFLIDMENKYWPSRPDDFILYGKYGGYNVYGKHFDAGEKVNVPCYGWDESWDKTAERLFLNPSYFVVAWDNDASAQSFTYEINGSVYNVNSFSPADKGGSYNVLLDYVEGGVQINLNLTARDPQASVTADAPESFVLEQGTDVSVNYTVTSEGGDNAYDFCVTFSMKEKATAKITVNPYISEHFGAKTALTKMYIADNAGKTTDTTDKMLTYDDNGYAKSAVYSVTYTKDSQKVTETNVSYSDLYNYIGVYDDAAAKITGYNYGDESVVSIKRGERFFTDSHYFGITGTAFDNASHVMTSRQLAPGRVVSSSFNDASAANEFKSWLLNDESTVFSLTPNTDCVVYAAFAQKTVENHTKFINDGWTFNNYSNTKIPKEAVLPVYNNVKKPAWWMVDASYMYNGNPFVLTKMQYDQQSPTMSVNYFYIWSKEVKAGETVDIPAGGSAFGNLGDQNAPKILIGWTKNLPQDDVSGRIFAGSSQIKIDNVFDSLTYNAIANVGDTVSFVPNGGAAASFSKTIINSLPCETTVEITSEAGSKVTHTIKFRAQPKILNITPSPVRDKFVSNTGANKISLSSRKVGELTTASVNIQKFEPDETGTLQPVYNENGKYEFETLQKTVGMPFYTDRTQHKFAHVGEAFKNMQYFTIPSNDATVRRQSVYTNENTTYFNKYGENKMWQYTDDSGTVKELNHQQMSSEYENYILGDNEYFSFTASDYGTVYVALESSSSNFAYANGWRKLTVDAALPEGHAGWNSVEADCCDNAYPYQLGKIQYDGHATEYHKFNTIYYKHFEGNQKVSVPTTGIAGSDVCAVMVDWNEFISDDFGGTLFYNDNKMKIRSSRSSYTVSVTKNENISLDFIPGVSGARAKLSKTEIAYSDLPKTITIDAYNYFGGVKTFEITFEKSDLGDKKILNFDTASQYGLYSENTDNNKSFISFYEGVYMVENNLERNVSAYYSDRLTHKFTKDNTSDMFEGATYIRRPKKSGDYGYFGISGNSDFYTNDDYSENGTYGNWISFSITSPATVYVGVPFDSWPNKPADWQEVSDPDVLLGGSKKLYKKSFEAGSFVTIPSHGWDLTWNIAHTSWDLPIYVVVWE